MAGTLVLRWPRRVRRRRASANVRPKADAFSRSLSRTPRVRATSFDKISWSPQGSLLLGRVPRQPFVESAKAGFAEAAPGPLLNAGVATKLGEAVSALGGDGAAVLTGGGAVEGDSCRFQNTLMRVDGAAFLENPEGLQREAFGNAGLLVVAKDEDEVVAISGAFEGNLTGCVYSDTEGSDDALYDRVVRRLRPLVGRLLNDKMPTGVAVSPAMNHGGPFPATGHPGFSAVGIPGSIRRFAMLECYDGVRDGRLPVSLRNKNPDGKLWRSIDGVPSQGDVA